MIEHKHVVISKRLVTINAASSVAAKVINMTVLLWMYQYLLKRIPPEQFAVYPVMMALMVFAPLFFSFFTSGISRYVVEAYARGAFEQVTCIVTSILPPIALATVVFLGAGTVFAYNVEHVLNVDPSMVDDARIMLLLLVASFAIQMLALPFGTGFHVRQRFVELNALGIGRDLMRIALLFTFLLGMGPRVLWVVVATVIAEACYTMVMVARSRRMVPELRFCHRLFAMKQARELFSFGIWSTLGNLGAVMFTHAGTILLNLFGTAVDVTVYHISSTFYRQIDAAIALGMQPLQPVLTAMYSLDDRKRLARTVLRGGQYALWIALAGATPLVIYAEEFIQLYAGETYSAAATVVVFFMAILPLAELNRILAMTAVAMGRVKGFYLPAFLFQCCGFALMWYFIKVGDMGAAGAGLGLTIMIVTSQAYYWPLCMKLTGVGFRDFVNKTVAPGLLPAVGGSLVWVGLKLYQAPETWLLLIIYGCAGAAAYLGVATVIHYWPTIRRRLQLPTEAVTGTQV